MRQLIVLIAVVALGFVACDKVDDPFEGVVSSGGELVGDTNWTDTTHMFRKIFAEEFTGHTCQSCPQNSEKLNGWAENEYDNQLIIVAIHYGLFADPQPSKGYPTDWRVEAGKDIHDLYNPNQYPSAGFNRLQSGPLPPGQWQSELASLAPSINDPIIKLDIRNIRNDTENKNLLYFRAEAIKDMSGDYSLGILVVEDSIIAPQTDVRREIQGLDPKDEDYVHRHMLRGSIGPSAGNSFITDGLAKGERVEASYEYTPSDDQNPKHLIFVGFVRNLNSNEIVQVEEIHGVSDH